MEQPASAPFLDQIISQLTHRYVSLGLAASFKTHLPMIFITLIMAFLAYRFWISPWVDGKIRGRAGLVSGATIWMVLVKRLSMPVIWLALLWIVDGVFRHYHGGRGWFYLVEVLLVAWIVSRFFITIIIGLRLQKLHQALGVAVTFVVWLTAVLEISHLLSPTLAILDQIDLHLGLVRISLLHLLSAGILLSLFLWLSRAVTSSFSSWISGLPNINPSFQALTQKLFAVGFYTLAMVIILGGLGVDLKSLAWFSGAIGLGLGFGLQKVISNLASGFIILADKSIKPGDVIQVGETYGWINHLGSRYISVISRDAIEYLIPNEDLITGRVVNWSYSQDLLRLKIPVGIAFGSDLEMAMELMLEAARSVTRVLPAPEPSVRLIGFGDSAINFQVRVWINDPKNGIRGVTSDVSLEIYKRFQKHGIDIPFPQRVLYHQTLPEIKLAPAPE